MRRTNWVATVLALAAAALLAHGLVLNMQPRAALPEDISIRGVRLGMTAEEVAATLRIPVHAPGVWAPPGLALSEISFGTDGRVEGIQGDRVEEDGRVLVRVPDWVEGDFVLQGLGNGRYRLARVRRTGMR